ncbi:aquaporin-4-like [Apostichopus japonicus]|uniref:aquaporin-4-like n=1 Tax=Stichopus japonicus TaxID=307972 RepID=UPI003AB1B54C
MDRLKIMHEELQSVKFWRAVLAEFVAMVLLLFVGLGATSTFGGQSADTVHIALVFGLAIATLVHCTAHISGGHLNPAVTLAFLVMHRITPLRATLYIASQMLGATVGTALCRLVTPLSNNRYLGPTVVDEDILPSQAIVVEILLTFQLVWTVFATVDGGRKDITGSGPLAIGISVVIGHLSGIKYTGASMNPARSFGSAAIGGQWENHWVYWVGPALGGIIAAMSYDWIMDPNSNWDRVKKCATCEYGETENDEENHVTVLEPLPGNSARNG